ncbi:MAG: hypothetical protein JRI23_27115 [Deltaproteobacteria bacterium]|jgi:hypothetical protein|nr:hypothetical protein [Deltaproteobacteria bacterium]MBW2535753.1 hypothetical protein [Deltaproteobacteria bacterium]
MVRTVFIAVLGAVTCSGIACHLAGGLSDLSFVRTGETGGSGGGSSSSSTSSGGGGAAGATSTGGSAGSTGTGGAGGTVEPPCYPPGVQDGFGGSTLDSSLWSTWTDSTTTFGVEGGIAWVAPPPSQSGSAYGDFYTASLALTDCSAWIEVVTILPTATPVETYFGLYNSGTNRARFHLYEGYIEFDVQSGGSIVASDTISYDSIAHRWLRFREQGGRLYHETSPDALDWTERLSYPTPSWIDSVELFAGAGTWGYTDTPGRAEFDNVNLLP